MYTNCYNRKNECKILVGIFKYRFVFVVCSDKAGMLSSIGRKI